MFFISFYWYVFLLLPYTLPFPCCDPLSKIHFHFSWTDQSFILLYNNNILVPPKIAPFDFGDETSNSADSASVACLVITGDLPISFRWFFNDRPVKEFAGITTVKLGNRNSVLNIDSVTARHAGRYVCEASNEAASVNYTSELSVNGTNRHTLNNQNIVTAIAIDCRAVYLFMFCFWLYLISFVILIFEA